MGNAKENTAFVRTKSAVKGHMPRAYRVQSIVVPILHARGLGEKMALGGAEKVVKSVRHISLLTAIIFGNMKCVAYYNEATRG